MRLRAFYIVGCRDLLLATLAFYRCAEDGQIDVASEPLNRVSQEVGWFHKTRFVPR